MKSVQASMTTSLLLKVLNAIVIAYGRLSVNPGILPLSLYTVIRKQSNHKFVFSLVI